jgi:large subunit ribosomal protein L22
MGFGRSQGNFLGLTRVRVMTFMHKTKMKVRALSKYVYVSDEKARDIAHNIIAMNGDEVVQLRKFMPRKSARFIEKTLPSAITNAICRGIRSEVLTAKDGIAEQGLLSDLLFQHRADGSIRSKNKR